MQKITTSEFSIQLLFDQMSDGRYFVHSPHVPGLRLAGFDLDALRSDIEPVVKDLLFHNRDLDVESIRWVPSIEEMFEELEKPEKKDNKQTYLVKLSGVA